MKILIVDCFAFMRMVVRNILIEHKVKIIYEANDGLEGFIKYQQLRPDVVIMDLVLGKMSGIETIKEIKKFDRYAKIIVCTSLGQRMVVQETMKLGAIDFIIKPFKPERLLEALRKVRR